MRWLGPYLSKGKQPFEKEGRYADEETMNHIIELRKKVRIYEDAVQKIYWETNEPFINNIAYVALKEAEKV